MCMYLGSLINILSFVFCLLPPFMYMCTYNTETCLFLSHLTVYR